MKFRPSLLGNQNNDAHVGENDVHVGKIGVDVGKIEVHVVKASFSMDFSLHTKVM